MATSAGTVTADFDARSAKFAAELAKVQKGLSGLQKDVRGISNFLKSTGSLLAGVFSVGALTAFVKSAGDVQTKLAETASAAGITTTNLKALQLVTRESGGSVDALSNALLDAQKNLGLAAAGTGKAGRFIAALGLDVAQLQSLSPDQLFLTYSDAIAKLGSQSEQVAAAQVLFGDSAKQVLNTIRGGRPAFEEAAEAVRKLGLVLKPEQVAMIDAAGDALDRVKDAAQAFGSRVAASLGPFIVDFANQLLNVGTSAEDSQAAIDKFVDGAYTGLQILLNGVNTLRAGFFGLAAGIAKVGELATFGGISDSLQAAVDANLEKAQNALNAVKSFEQISADIQRIREAAEAQAAAAGVQNAVTGSTLPTLSLKPDAFDPLKGLNTDELVNEQFQKEQEQRLAIIADFAEQEFQMRRNLADRQRELAAQVADFEIAQRARVLSLTLGLLNTLGSKHKAFAVAAIVLSRALAIKEAAINTAVAVTNALRNVPYPANLAAAAQMKTMGAIQIGLIAATGALEVANTLSGNRGGIGNSGVGTPTNPLPVTSSDATSGATPRGATQIIFNGPVAGAEAFIEIIKQAIGDDVVIIPYGSRQAAEIRGGA